MPVRPHIVTEQNAPERALISIAVMATGYATKKPHPVRTTPYAYTRYSYGYYWLPHSSTVLRLQLLTLLRLVVEKQLLPPPLATGELESDAAAVNWCPRPSHIFQIQDFFLLTPATCPRTYQLPSTTILTSHMNIRPIAAMTDSIHLVDTMP